MKLDVIYNEDCLEGMKRLPDHSIDCIISDLPYGLTQNKWDSVIPFAELWEQYLRIAKFNATIVLTASQPFTSALVMSQPKLFRHEWVWIKNRGGNFANTVREPMKEHESVLVFSRGRWTYNKQMQSRSGSGLGRFGKPNRPDGFLNSKNYGKGNKKRIATILPELRVPCSWQKFNVERAFHPTQKPVALFEYLIRTYTNPNEIVLDNCMGSGTTAIACINTGRRYIGFEKDPKYFAVAQKRISDHQPPLIHKEAA